jgi:hypothetical protein
LFGRRVPGLVRELQASASGGWAAGQREISPHATVTTEANRSEPIIPSIIDGRGEKPLFNTVPGKGPSCLTKIILEQRQLIV